MEICYLKELKQNIGGNMREITSLPEIKNGYSVYYEFLFGSFLIWVFFGFYPYPNSLSIFAGSTTGLLYSFFRADWSFKVYLKAVAYSLLIFWSFELVQAFKIYTERASWPNVEYKILLVALPTITLIPLFFGCFKKLIKKPLK